MKTVFLLLAILGCSHGAAISQLQPQSADSHDLANDLRDFISLLPLNEIKGIIEDNLDDPEVQQVLAYIVSDEFKGLLADVAAMPEYKEVVSYLEASGLPVSKWIQALKDYLGFTKMTPTVYTTRGVNTIIQQIKAILPIAEIKDLYHEKLTSSPAFAELVEKIKSPVFLNLVHKVAALPEVRRIAQELRNMGVDIDSFIDLVKRIFGFNQTLQALRSTHSLADDLKDFLNLIPFEEILSIVVENLDDPEINQVLAYIGSDKFVGLLKEIAAIPESKEIVGYLEANGLPVNKWIQALKDFLGLSKMKPTAKNFRGLNDVIQQIKGVLPIAEIKTLYQEKLSNSPAFVDFVKQIKGPVFSNFVKKVAALPEVQRVAQELKEMGVDISSFIKLIKSIFGFN